MNVCVYTPSPLFYINSTIYTVYIHCPAPYFFKLAICLGGIFIFIHKELSSFFFKIIFHCLCCSIFNQSCVHGHRGFPGLLLLPVKMACVIIKGAQQGWRYDLG